MNVLNIGIVNEISNFRIQGQFSQQEINSFPNVISPIIQFYKHLQDGIFSYLKNKQYQKFTQLLKYPQTQVQGPQNIIESATAPVELDHVPAQFSKKILANFSARFVQLYGKVIFICQGVDNKRNAITQLCIQTPIIKMNLLMQNQTGSYLFYPYDLIQVCSQYANQYIKEKKRKKQIISYIDNKNQQIRLIIEKQSQLLNQRGMQSQFLNQKINIYIQQQLKASELLNSQISKKLKETDQLNLSMKNSLNQIQTKQGEFIKKSSQQISNISNQLQRKLNSNLNSIQTKQEQFLKKAQQKISKKSEQLQTKLNQIKTKQQQFIKKSQQKLSNASAQLQKKIQNTTKEISKANQLNQSKFKQFEKDQEKRQVYVQELDKVKSQLTKQISQMQKRKQSLEQFGNNIQQVAENRQRTIKQLIQRVQSAGKNNLQKQQSQNQQMIQFKSTILKMVSDYNLETKNTISENKKVIQDISDEINLKIIESTNVLGKISKIQSNVKSGLTTYNTKLGQFQKSISAIKLETDQNGRIVDEAKRHIDASVEQIRYQHQQLNQMLAIVLSMLRIQFSTDLQSKAKQININFTTQLAEIRNQFNAQLLVMRQQSSKLTDTYLKGIQSEIQAISKTIFQNKIKTETQIQNIYSKGNQLYKKIKRNEDSYQNDKFNYVKDFSNLYKNQSTLSNDVSNINKFIQNQRFIKTIQSNVGNRYYIDASFTGLSTKIQQIKENQLLKKDQYNKILKNIEKQLNK